MKKDLLQVVHPGYNTTYHYYHENCLKEVLRDPEKYEKYLDTAIQIQDQINDDQQKLETKRRHLEHVKARATEIFKSTYAESKIIEPKAETIVLPIKDFKMNFIRNKK